MNAIKEFVTPKAFNKFSFMANALWFGLEVMLSGIFLDIEINESRSDFRCGANDNKDLIQGFCYQEYEDRYNKFGVPVYAFVILNFLIIAIICVVYSTSVKSRICELEDPNEEVEGQRQQETPPRRNLFKAYLFQLAIRLLLWVALMILQTMVLYPSNFPSKFSCHLKGNSPPSGNITKAPKSYECHNQRATRKNFWIDFVTGLNGTYASLVFIEFVCILLRAGINITFTEDSSFHATYLDISPNNRVSALPDQGRQQQQAPLEASIKNMKVNVRNRTERLKDLNSPFRHNPGEGNKPTKDLQLDEIYTNLIIRQGRANYNFSGDRKEQLKVFPRSNKKFPPIQPWNVVDAENKNVLVVGRPGIGKTLFCIKLLRDWASDSVVTDVENSQLEFEAAFLLKFRRLNCVGGLTLRELLAYSEYSTQLNDEDWNYICENPTKVLLIFDGIDEFQNRTKIACSDFDHRHDNTEKMPVYALYNKLTSGKLLRGATILSTTRPNAVSCVTYVNFNRVVEILGFTPEQVQKYVKKFTQYETDSTGRTIWQHISSNLNIFSLCYVPVNCFIICTCLLHALQTLQSCAAFSVGVLPTRLTDIYSTAIKIFYFRHDDKYRNCDRDPAGQDVIYEPFDKLPDDAKADFKRLGKIAFKGMEEGRLIFESEEVKGLENCGLLHRLPDLEAPAQRPFQTPKAQFCFIHLTIQEFLAAKHVTDTMNDEELREYASEHIGQGAWQLVLQFIAGLLSRRGTSSIRIFTDILPVSTERKDSMEVDSNKPDSDLTSSKLTFWPLQKDCHVVQTLSMCLFEIDAKDSALQTKLNEINFNAANFRDCILGPVECLGVVNLLKGHRVVYLNLRNNNIGSLGCTEIHKLLVSENNEDSCTLGSLNLSLNNIGQEGVTHLVPALTQSNCKLNSLNLSANNINDNGVNQLVKALCHMNCKLSSLNISENKISGQGIKHFVKALTHTNCKLSSLNISDNKISNEGVKHLAEALIDTNCKLSTLNLSNSEIGDQGVNDLVKALIDKKSKLISLDLSWNNIGDRSIEDLVRALVDKNCKVITFNLANNNLKGKHLKQLAGALTNRNCKLNSLNLLQNPKIINGIWHLGVALKHANCRLISINLSGCKINQIGVTYLAEALRDTNCKLSTLNLSGNPIKDDGVKHLAEALKHRNCKLRSLNLSNNNITDLGVSYLANKALVNENCKVNSLNLSLNEIRSGGLKEFLQAITHINCKINTLNLSRINLRGEPMKHLVEALIDEGCKLESLNLSNCGITVEDVKLLAEALTKGDFTLTSLNLSDNFKITGDEEEERIVEALFSGDRIPSSLNLSLYNTTSDKGVESE